MIISISGYAGSGKDTVGRMIQYLTSDMPIKGVPYEDWDGQTMWGLTPHEWQIKKWAGKLKTIASILTGISTDKFEDQDFKKTNMPAMWNYLETKVDHLTGDVHQYEVPMGVRDFLQKLGTDGLRNGLHTNVWVNALLSEYAPNGMQDDIGPNMVRIVPPSKWIITDTRFPNEAQAVKQSGGITIRIDRPGVSAVNAHPSETALDNWTFDYVIVNGGSEKDLLKYVEEVLKHVL